MATLIQAAPPTKKPRQKQTSRDVLAHIFMAAWICVILQGALRKWVFPGVSIVYLVQDVPLLFAYIYAIWKGLFWDGKLAWTCMLISALVTIQTMLQIIFSDLHVRTAVVGLHHYIFYLPILFIAPVCYNFKHRLRFIRWNMISIIPMAMIAALQSRAPKGAWINRTSAGDETGFALPGAGVRATGTFNFALTYAVWCGFVVGLVLGEWLLPPDRRSFKSKAMLLLCTMGAIVATLVSGSRSAVMLAVLAFMGGFLAVVVTRNVKLILRFSVVLLLLPVLTMIAYFAAPASFNALLNRFSGEENEQAIGLRIEKMVGAFTYATDYSVLGLGIGYGIPAANPSMGPGIILSENEPIRIVQEMGTFTGSGLVLLRYGAGLLLFLLSLRALQLPRRHNFPHAVPLAFAVGPTLTVGDLTSSAPVIATQTFFVMALILGALLFKREPFESSAVELSKTR